MPDLEFVSSRRGSSLNSSKRASSSKNRSGSSSTSIKKEPNVVTNVKKPSVPKEKKVKKADAKSAPKTSRRRSSVRALEDSPSKVIMANFDVSSTVTATDEVPFMIGSAKKNIREVVSSDGKTTVVFHPELSDKTHKVYTITYPGKTTGVRFTVNVDDNTIISSTSDEKVKIKKVDVDQNDKVKVQVSRSNWKHKAVIGFLLACLFGKSQGTAEVCENVERLVNPVPQIIQYLVPGIIPLGVQAPLTFADTVILNNAQAALTNAQTMTNAMAFTFATTVAQHEIMKMTKESAELRKNLSNVNREIEDTNSAIATRNSEYSTLDKLYKELKESSKEAKGIITSMTDQMKDLQNLIAKYKNVVGADSIIEIANEQIKELEKTLDSQETFYLLEIEKFTNLGNVDLVKKNRNALEQLRKVTSDGIEKAKKLAIEKASESFKKSFETSQQRLNYSGQCSKSFIELFQPKMAVTENGGKYRVVLDTSRFKEVSGSCADVMQEMSERLEQELNGCEKDCIQRSDVNIDIIIDQYTWYNHLGISLPNSNRIKMTLISNENEQYYTPIDIQPIPNPNSITTQTVTTTVCKYGSILAHGAVELTKAQVKGDIWLAKNGYKMLNGAAQSELGVYFRDTLYDQSQSLWKYLKENGVSAKKIDDLKNVIPPNTVVHSTKQKTKSQVKSTTQFTQSATSLTSHPTSMVASTTDSESTTSPSLIITTPTSTFAISASVTTSIVPSDTTKTSSMTVATATPSVTSVIEAITSSIVEPSSTKTPSSSSTTVATGNVGGVPVVHSRRIENIGGESSCRHGGGGDNTKMFGGAVEMIFCLDDFIEDAEIFRSIRLSKGKIPIPQDVTETERDYMLGKVDNPFGVTIDNINMIMGQSLQKSTHLGMIEYYSGGTNIKPEVVTNKGKMMRIMAFSDGKNDAFAIKKDETPIVNSLESGRDVLLNFSGNLVYRKLDGMTWGLFSSVAKGFGKDIKANDVKDKGKDVKYESSSQVTKKKVATKNMAYETAGTGSSGVRA